MKQAVEYVRMERASTGSFMTYKLPKRMPFSYACDWAESELPGWEVIHGCIFNPDGLMLDGNMRAIGGYPLLDGDKPEEQ